MLFLVLAKTAITATDSGEGEDQCPQTSFCWILIVIKSVISKRKCAVGTILLATPSPELDLHSSYTSYHLMPQVMRALN